MKAAALAKDTPDTQTCAETLISTDPITTYREVQIGKVLYQVTSVFLGKFTLKSALEDLAVQRVLQTIRLQEDWESTIEQ